MIIVLLIACLILIYWVTKLSANLEELRKINQYNFEVYSNKFKDIEDSFKHEREQREQLLERIRDIEKTKH